MSNPPKPPAPTANPLAVPTRPAARFTVSRPAAVGERVRQAVVLCRDCSPSMAGGKDASASQAVREFVEELAQPFNKDAFDIAIVDFNDSAHAVHPLSRASALLPVLAPIGAGGSGTDVASALTQAEAILQAPMPSEGRNVRPVVILFTDGNHNQGADPQAAATHLRPLADVVTVGFGADADEALLTALATSPAHFYRCTNGAQLRTFLVAVAGTLSTTRAKGANATRALGELKQP